jgi:hypothetical protein
MKAISLATAACLTAGSVLANGGGYAHRGVSETGTIAGFEPQDTDKVRILDERLDVALARGAAKVQVRYVLKNTSKQPANVRFGFPVEELAEVPVGVETPEQNPKAKTAPKLESCRDYEVELAGKPLVAAFE